MTMLRRQFTRSLLSGLLATCLALVLLLPAWAAADDRDGFRRPYDRIVVFGTSLSDPGNAFALTGRHLGPQDVRLEDFLIPDFPYAIGGNHFSNGPTWIEQLARPIGLGWSVRPAYVSSTGGSSNYAVGGTRARDGVAGEVSLSEQVTRFLQDVGPSTPTDALYVVEMGGNDIRDALDEAFHGRDPTPVLEGAIAGVIGNIGRLYGAGARKFLVWRAPNVGLAPAIQFFGPAGVIGATNASVAFNQGLDYYLETRLSGLPGIELIRFDASGAIGDIVANPRAYGLIDAKTACIDPRVTPYPCQRPDRYFFWDGIHPTRAGHTIIAVLVARTLIAHELAGH
jgi:outer membrane lipase/esterase